MTIFKSIKHIVIPLLLILTVGAFVHIYRSTNQVEKLLKVQIGKDYYIQVVLLEVTPTNTSAEAWDSYDETGPDVYAEIFWQDQRVYKSSVKTDSLVARWSSAELDLRNLAISGSPTSVDDVIPAARINIKPQDQIEVKVYDRDLLTQDEQIASIKLRTIDLNQGQYTYFNPVDSVERLVLKVFLLDSIPELTE